MAGKRRRRGIDIYTIYRLPSPRRTTVPPHPGTNWGHDLERTEANFRPTWGEGPIRGRRLERMAAIPSGIISQGNLLYLGVNWGLTGCARPISTTLHILVHNPIKINRHSIIG